MCGFVVVTFRERGNKYSSSSSSSLYSLCAFIFHLVGGDVDDKTM